MGRINNIKNALNYGDNQQVREELIAYNKELKDAVNEGAIVAELYDLFLGTVVDEDGFFRALLENEDAKVRKNTIKLMGFFNTSHLGGMLFEAYMREQTLFLKSEYLKVLSHFSVKSYLDAFAERAAELKSKSDEGDNEKHLASELAELTNILRTHGKIKDHKFVDSDVESTMILTTPIGMEQVVNNAVIEALGVERSTPLVGGVKVNSRNYEALFKLRCYQDLLFVVDGVNGLMGTPAQIANQTINKGLLDYLDERMTGDKSYRFYVSVKGKLTSEAKAKLTKNLSAELAKCSDRRLINSPSNYEIELQYRKNAKNGTYSLYLNIPSLLCGRFDYRNVSLSASMKPYIAALINEYVYEDTKECERVLDPYCGTGTLLIERKFKCYGNTLTGVDIYGKAIWAARDIADQLGMAIDYVDKDNAEFEAIEPYDMILTDMPVHSTKITEGDIRREYDAFIRRVGNYMNVGGKIVIYTAEMGIMNDVIATKRNVKLIKSQEVYKNKSAVYVLEYVG